MNKNIEKMISKIMESPELWENLAWQRSLDDAYEFCRSVSGGYTKEEFEEFLDEVLDYEEPFPEEVDDEDMANIAGGMNRKSIYAKIMACSLSALTLASSANVGAVSNTSQTLSASKYQSVKANKNSFWERYKKIIIGLGVVGLAALIGGAVYYHNKKQTVTPEAEALGESKAEPQKTYSKKHRASKSGKNDDSNWAIDLYRGLKRALHKIPVIGPVISVAAVGGLIISDLGAISSAVSKIDNASWSFSKLVQKFADFRQSISNKINHEELSLNDAFDNLKYLFEEVKGQEKAKEQIKSIVYGILHRKNQAKLLGKKYDRGDVLYFYGPSGVGKTLIAQGLATYKILTSNAAPFYISASEVDKDSKETVIDQLFGANNYGYGGYDEYNGGNRVPSTPKSLVKYLSNNPDGVVIIDEYDKMWSPALDEIFRTIMDHGVVSIKGQVIDCSGITFILTSNESTKSIQGGNQDGQTPEEVDDGTGSRTTIKHDKSFLNRFQPVEFSNLSSKEYAQIIQKEFKDDLVGYWADPEVNGIDIVIDDDCLANMAEVVENKNIGARYITKLQSDLFRDISMKVFDAEVKEKDFYRGKKIFVSFNPATEEFTLKDEKEKSAPETVTRAAVPAGIEVQ